MATAQLSSGARISEDDVTCSICQELFTSRPKMLPCQHTFCQDCLQKLAGRQGTIRCPTCRRQVTLPPKGVAGLPDNRLVRSLCERFQNQVLSEEASEEFQSGNRCSIHPSREAQLYCKPCHVPICDWCLEKAHEGHLNTSIKKAAKDRRPVIQDLIKDGRKIMETFSNLDKQEKELNQQKQQTDKSIRMASDQMVQKVKERKDQLLSQVEQNYNKNFDKIRNGRVLKKELSDACDQAEQAMEHEGILFLSQENILTQVIGKYLGKAAPTPVQTQPDVFQPTETPVPALGYLKPLPSTPPVQKTTASSSTGTQGTGQSVENALHEYRSVSTVGKQGSENGHFDDPKGVKVSEDGEIFVADCNNQRINIMTKQGDCWKFRQFTTVLPDGEKMSPTDVAMDGEGNLWVVGYNDSADFAVQYDKQGIWVLRTIDLQHTEWIRGIAVDTRRNHILITQITGDEDNLHGEVLVFQQDGTLVRTVGAQSAHVHGTWIPKKLRKLVGTGGGQQQGLAFPRYITVDGEGNILVSDIGNKCIYLYNEYGKLLLCFGGEESGEGQLKEAGGLCTDKSGNIIVADRGNNQLKLFDSKGKFLRHITVGKRVHHFVPHAVAFTKQGHLVVTDCQNHQVFIFCR